MSNFFMNGYQIGYIKKEDAKRILKSKQIYPVVIIVGLSTLFGVMQLFIQPRLYDLTRDFGADLPGYNSPYIGIALLILAAYLIFPDKQKDEAELDKKLSQYKPGEMILVGDLMDHRQEWKTMLVVVLFVGYIILTNVLPIYNLTSSF